MIAANSYSASLTREQFLFSETRIVAQLMDKGLDEAAIYEKIVSENLFQLPTEKSVRSLIRPCVRRLKHRHPDGTDCPPAVPLCHDAG